jgi:hypothetical protein
MGLSSPVSKLRTATDSSSKSLESFTRLSRFFGDESSSDANFPLGPSVCNNNNNQKNAPQKKISMQRSSNG